jgi:hypothetical protein
MAGKPEEPHPSDALLANLYWSMKLLGRVPPEVADWRFLWRWLKGWGLAPQLSECLDREPWELDLLRGAAATRQEDLIARPWEPHRRLFASAARRVELFLREV